MNQELVNNRNKSYADIVLAPPGARTMYSLSCVEDAAKLLNLDCKYLGEFQDILVVEFKSKNPLYFWRNKHPFNNSLTEFANDKILQIQILQDLAKSTDLPFKLPQTSFYFKPENLDQDLPKITEEIFQNFKFPFILKNKHTSFAKGVYLVNSEAELSSKLREIFQSGDQRTGILIQEFINGTEYRLVSKDEKARLVYSKIGNLRFDSDTDNFSPHKLESDLEKFDKVATVLSKHLSIRFAGTDLILTDQNELYLIEVNMFPVAFVYSNLFGSQDFVTLYQEFLEEYQNSQ